MARVAIDLVYCKGCGLCIAVCPKKILRRGATLSPRSVHATESLTPDECTGCLQCVLMCPDAAITIVETTPRKVKR